MEAPVSVTDDRVLVIEAAEDVSHDPAMLIAAEPKVAVAAPLEVRFAPNATVEESSVSAPDQVMLEANEVVTPGLTVTLFSGWGAFTVPPDPATTIVEVPEVKAPAEESIEVTVMMLPRAVRRPPAPTVSVVTVIGRLPTEVSKEVVAAPSLTWTLPAFRPRVAIVKVCAVAAVDAKTTAANSGPLRLPPAKVIVPPVAELKVTVAVPADQDVDVELSVHAPPNVHVAPPKLK